LPRFLHAFLAIFLALPCARALEVMSSPQGLPPGMSVAPASTRVDVATVSAPLPTPSPTLTTVPTLPVKVVTQPLPRKATPMPPGKEITTPSGLKTQVLKRGTGAVAVAGKTVTVHYTGWLLKGRKKFDSSLDRKEPFSFPLGYGQVIRGWDEGVVGMKVGEKRKLTIPPELAYGAGGVADVIPPNATLVFHVDLLEVE